jgi:hypothetical protein
VGTGAARTVLARAVRAKVYFILMEWVRTAWSDSESKATVGERVIDKVLNASVKM